MLSSSIYFESALMKDRWIDRVWLQMEIQEGLVGTKSQFFLEAKYRN
jgi:hypothetical protein